MAYYTHNCPSYPPYAPQTRQDASLLVKDASVVVEGPPLSPHECPDSRSCLSSLACSPVYADASTLPQAAYDTALCLSGHYDASPTSCPIVDQSYPYPGGQDYYGDASTLTQDSSAPHLYHGITVSIAPRTSLDHSSVYTDAAATHVYGPTLELSVDRDRAYSYQYTSQTQQDAFLFTHDASTSAQVALPSHVSYGSPETGSSVTSSHYSPVSMDAATLPCEGYSTSLNMSVRGGQDNASLIPSMISDQDDHIYCGTTFISAQNSVDIPSPLGSPDSTTSQDALQYSPGHFDVTALQHAEHDITIGGPYSELHTSSSIHDLIFDVDRYIYPQMDQVPRLPALGTSDLYTSYAAEPGDSSLILANNSSDPCLPPMAPFDPSNWGHEQAVSQAVTPVVLCVPPLASPEPCRQSSPLPIAAQLPMYPHASHMPTASQIADQLADLSLNAAGESDNDSLSDEDAPVAAQSLAPASGAVRTRIKTSLYNPYARPPTSPDASCPSSVSSAAVFPALSALNVVSSNSDKKLHHTTPRNRQCLGKRIEMPEEGLTCPECKKEFGGRSDLRRHISTHNPDDPRAICGGLPREKALEAGIDVDACEPYVWGGVEYFGGCFNVFARPDSLRRHLRITSTYDHKCVSNVDTPYNVGRLGRSLTRRPKKTETTATKKIVTTATKNTT